MIYIGSGAQDNPRYYLVKHITVKPIIKHILQIKFIDSHTSHHRPFTFPFSGAPAAGLPNLATVVAFCYSCGQGQGQHLRPRESVATDGLTWGNYD